MYSAVFTNLLLNSLLAIYLLFHIPLDIYMILKRDKTLELKNYGVRDLEAVNAILGITSTIFWIVWYTNLVFGWITSESRFMNLFRLQINPDFSFILQQIGMLLMIFAVVLAIWARIQRGKYSASWGLKDDYPLITSGPYRWIRHPTYTFYFLMFIGFPLFTLIWPLFLLMIGIYGYTKTVETEENMLILHFGDDYRNYQKNTKKFIPYVW